MTGEKIQKSIEQRGGKIQESTVKNEGKNGNIGGKIQESTGKNYVKNRKRKDTQIYRKE